MHSTRCPACSMADLELDHLDGLHCPKCFYKPGPRRVGEEALAARKADRRVAVPEPPHQRQTARVKAGFPGTARRTA